MNDIVRNIYLSALALCLMFVVAILTFFVFAIIGGIVGIPAAFLISVASVFPPGLEMIVQTLITIGWGFATILPTSKFGGWLLNLLIDNVTEKM